MDNIYDRTIDLGNQNRMMTGSYADAKKSPKERFAEPFMTVCILLQRFADIFVVAWDSAKDRPVQSW